MPAIIFLFSRIITFSHSFAFYSFHFFFFSLFLFCVQAHRMIFELPKIQWITKTPFKISDERMEADWDYDKHIFFFFGVIVAIIPWKIIEHQLIHCFCESMILSQSFKFLLPIVIWTDWLAFAEKKEIKMKIQCHWALRE